MEDTQRKIKSFFERPEGTTGMIFIFVGILLFLFAGNYLMPFIITALANTLYATLLGGALLAIIALVMNGKVQAISSSIFKSAMRALTSIFITIDPIGILKNYLDNMDDKLKNIGLNIGKLNGQKQKLDRLIVNEQKIVEDATYMASAAKKQNNQVAMVTNTRKVARSNDFIKKLQTMHDKMEFLGKNLMKMRNSVEALREDTADQIRILEIEYESVKASYKAMKSAEVLISGSDAKDLFEQSAEFLADDIANKLGEMETFMTLSESFLTNIDLQNGIWDEKGLAMLEDFEQNGSLLSYDEKRDVGGKVRIETKKENQNTYENQTQNNSVMESFFTNKV